jgi:hypothetical protein
VRGSDGSPVVEDDLRSNATPVAQSPPMGKCQHGVPAHADQMALARVALL